MGGGGWLPAEPTPDVLVGTPLVFLHKTGQWDIHPLTRKETLQAWGLSHAAVQILDVGGFGEGHLLHPIETLLAGLLLLLGIGELHGGGGGLQPLTRTEGAALAWITGQKRQADLGAPATKRAWRGDPEPQAHLGNAQPKGCKRTQEAPEDDSREWNATKSVDARVPIHLWSEQFMAAGVTGTTGDMDTIERTLKTLRHKLFIRVWKRQLTKSFFSWMGQRYPDSYQALDQCLMPSDHFVSTTQGPSGLDGFSMGVPRPRWAWAANGKKHYYKWHQARCTIGGADYEAGADALWRACGASWWEWELGFTPFHWRWPHFYQSTIRDGLEVYIKNKILVYRIPHRDTKDASQKEAMVDKLHKI